MNDPWWWQRVELLGSRTAELLDELEGQCALLSSGKTGDEVLVILDGILRRLDHPRSASALLANAHPSTEVRDQARAAQRAILSFLGRLLAMPELHLTLCDLASRAQDPDARRWAKQLAEQGRLYGAAMTPDEAEELASLRAGIGRMGALYRAHLKRPAPPLMVEDEAAMLGGMSQGWRATHLRSRGNERALQVGGPGGMRLLERCEVETTRRDYWEALNGHGWPDNIPVLKALLAQRQSLAECLNYDGWADLELSTMMVGSPEGVKAFISRVAEVAEVRASQERAELERATGLKSLSPWSIPFARRQVFTEEVPSSSLTRAEVSKALMTLLERALGWQITRQDGQRGWAPGVEAWEVSAEAERLGIVFVDLWARPGKAGRPKTMRVQTGVHPERTPAVVLFAGLKAPLEHEECLALCHELGHVVHHLSATRTRWIGLNGLPERRDEAEVAAHLFESWAWEPEPLGVMGWSSQDAARIARRERRTRGMRTMRQLLYAAYSLELHLKPSKSRDLDALDERLARRYAQGVPERLYAHFPHLVAYGASYIAYEWSRAMAHDVLATLDASPATAGALSPFVDRVLGRRCGARMDEALCGLLGRPWSLQPYLEWLGGH